MTIPTREETEILRTEFRNILMWAKELRDLMASGDIDVPALHDAATTLHLCTGHYQRSLWAILKRQSDELLASERASAQAAARARYGLPPDQKIGVSKLV